MKCPSCAIDLPTGAASCPSCTTPVVVTSASETVARRDEPTRAARPPAAGSSHGPSFLEARFPPGTVLAGRYRIVSLLGRGGMGEVYRADDLTLEQPVALKFLPEDMARHPGRLSRFLEEVKVARRITHPNVCRVYDVDEFEGERFLSMEYVDGENLSVLLRRIGRLPEAKAVEIAHQICDGLDAAHQQGILHRDLKPANLMIDNHGRARITDFGLARAAAAVTGGEIRSGTPAYMAPEQHAGREVSVRSDLYTLGLVLYELFTGRPAFTGDAPAEPARLDRATPPTPPSRLVEGLDPAIEQVILQCLEKDPGERPASARAVSTALPRGDAAGWRPAPDRQLPERRHWTMVRKLGAGGFGEVWLARHQKTGEQRVFKFAFDQESRRALEREITLFRLLQEKLGPRDDIARILDWSFDAPPCFIESDYTAGGNLDEWAERQGGLQAVPLTTRLEIVSQVATALAAAHSVGVLHQDVKPANVLITSDVDERIRARLSDFGIGRVTERERLAEAGITAAGLTELTATTTTSSMRGGTRLYLSPQRLEGRPATLQDDVYALGVMLYQIVAGDFSRALAPGWERDIDDELLREDVAVAVDGTPERRLGNARRLAERLRGLEERRRLRATERREREEARKAREALALARRRRHLVTAAIVVLAIFAGAMAVQSRRVAHEAEVARRVTDFLVDLFQVSAPDRALGHKILAREILDRGVERIAAELREQPRIRARLMHTMGEVYRGLGLYDEAISLLEEALEIRRRLHGNSHLEVAESLAALAGALNEKGVADRAEALGREGLEIRRRQLGDDHPVVAESLELVADSLFEKGDYQGAEQIYRQALTLRRRLADRTLDIAHNVRSLAAAVMSVGRLEEADALYGEALTLYRELLGDEHPEVAESLHHLALLHQLEGDYEEAESYFERSLAMLRRLLGDEHPYVASSLSHLALLVQSQGRPQDAEPLFLEALAIYRRTVGDEDLSVAAVLSSLAQIYRERGDLEQALRHGREALATYRQVLGEQHPQSAVATSEVAETLLASGDPGAAEMMQRSAVDQLRAVLPAKHWQIRHAESLLGACLGELGRYREAEPLLLTAYEALNEPPPHHERAAAAARRRLVHFYEAWGKPERADVYRQKHR